MTRGYNQDEELTSVSDWLGNTTDLGYNPDGDLTSISYPGTVTESLTYDDSDRLAGISDAAGSTSLLSETYTHNADNLLTAQSSSTVSYTPLHQVQNSELSGSTISYSYDAADRLTEIEGATTATLAYNGGSQLTTSTVGTAATDYGFDPDGDRTSVTPPTGAATENTYNQAQQLTGASTTGLTASYSYNGDGLRMSKRVNGTTEQYTWDQSGSLPLLLQDGSTDFIYGPGGITLEQVAAGTASYFLHDWQGSTVGLTSSKGSLVASFTYDAYGNLTSSSGSASTSLLFQGQYRDAETGFYYLQARYYDPSTGQFLTRDPLNPLVPYAYAVGDPVNASDPTGEMLTRGMVGSGISGPTTFAPPPATDQAAYYHRVTQETAPAPQVQSATAPAAAAGGGLSTTVGAASAFLSLPGLKAIAQTVVAGASAYIRAGGTGVYLKGVAGIGDTVEAWGRSLGPAGAGLTFAADLGSGSSFPEAAVQTTVSFTAGAAVGGYVGAGCVATAGSVTFEAADLWCAAGAVAIGGVTAVGANDVVGCIWSHIF